MRKIITAVRVEGINLPGAKNTTLGIFFKDSEGNDYLASFEVLPIYLESIRKSFQRMHAIKSNEVENAIRESRSTDPGSSKDSSGDTGEHDLRDESDGDKGEQGSSPATEGLG